MTTKVPIGPPPLEAAVEIIIDGIHCWYWAQGYVRADVQSSTSPSITYTVHLTPTLALCNCPSSKYRGKCKHAQRLRDLIQFPEVKPAEHTASSVFEWLRNADLELFYKLDTVGDHPTIARLMDHL